MGFSAAGPIPPGTPAGIARVYDNQEYPATYKFKAGNEGCHCRSIATSWWVTCSSHRLSA